MFCPYHFVFIIIHLISCHIFSSYICNFDSLSFQNLILIQDHFHLASIILNVPNCKYIACDLFWGEVEVTNVHLYLIVFVLCSKFLVTPH